MSEERKFCCGAEHEEHPDPRNYNWGKIGLGSTLKPYGKSESIPFKVLDQKRSNACGGFAAEVIGVSAQIQQKRGRLREAVVFGVHHALWCRHNERQCRAMPREVVRNMGRVVHAVIAERFS